jgi:hypothetical protein
VRFEQTSFAKTFGDWNGKPHPSPDAIQETTKPDCHLEGPWIGDEKERARLVLGGGMLQGYQRFHWYG